MNPEEGIAIWRPSPPVELVSATSPEDIAAHATALTERDIKSIGLAFSGDSFEMVSTFVWTRAITGLKKQIASLGMEFVGEMLRRPDIHDNSDPKTAISEQDAINLAEALGMLSPTETLRLKHSMELVSHFADSENAEREQMNREEAVGILRACVASILGKPHISPPIEFSRLRSALEAESFSKDDPRVAQIAESPYFFQRTTLSVLLSLLKTAAGAQLEHAVGNTNVIVPRLWSKLRNPERWQIGQTYAEVYNAGRRAAAIGLKLALSEVKGFDFVPETLRSNTFSATAHKVVEAHFSINNFYKEASPIGELASLGTTIPKPAFPVCMTATLCVYLGNFFGHSFNAQASANEILSALRKEQWEYYLNECLDSDNTILDKLRDQKPASRWKELSENYEFKVKDIREEHVAEFVEADTIDAIIRESRNLRNRNQN